MAKIEQVLWASIRQSDHLLYLKIREDAVMRLAHFFIGKQAEKHEHIANTDALPLKVGLRRAVLAEDTRSIITEHWIVMAKIMRTELPPACLRRQITHPEIAKSGPRSGTRRDRQANRSPVHYR